MGTTGKTTVDEMNIPFDEWGKMLDYESPIYDSEGNQTGVYTVQDEEYFDYERRLDEITKQDAVNFALQFWSKYKYSDGEVEGWTVDDDYAIYFAYDDGTLRDVKDNPKKALYRKGLIGVYVSTPDEEISWGGERAWDNGRPYTRPWGVHDEDGNEIKGDYHAYYENVGKHKVREKITYMSGKRPKHEVIRRSTVKRH